MATYLQRWETAKTKFTNATGVKKPSPKGFYNTFFNHSGLSSAMRDMDAVVSGMDAGKVKLADMSKAVQNAHNKAAALSRAISSYVSVLDNSASSEKADANTKSALYRHLKVLSAELKAMDAQAKQFVDAKKISLDTTLSGLEKAGKMMKAALVSACAKATLAVKRVQADPTPETFNAQFHTSDTPGRKVQVQLISADKELKGGRLSVTLIDPRTVADKLTPWQGNTSPNNHLPDTAKKEDVLKRLDEFKGLLKLAVAYSDSLG